MRRPTFHHRAHAALSYKPPPYLLWLRLGMTGAVVSALVAILWVGGWFLMATQFRGAVVDWLEARRTDGWWVRESDVELGGFPFLLSARVDRPGLGMPEGAPPWGWSAERVYVEARPWAPASIRLRPSGRQQFSIPRGDHRPPAVYSGQARSMTVSLDLDGDRLVGGGLSLAGLALRADDGPGAFAVARAEGSAAPSPDRPFTFRIRFEAEGIDLPAVLRLPLGTRLDSLSLEAGIAETLSLTPLQPSLVRWRDAGGTLEVLRLRGHYGPLAVNANGTVALDADLQPIASFTARIEGFFEAIDALRRTGLIRARDAVTAQVVLGALARRPDNGGPPSISVPLTVRRRTVFAGPVELASLAPVVWPGTPPLAGGAEPPEQGTDPTRDTGQTQ